MSGSNTTSSGTPISALPLASSVAATDTMLGIVGGGTTTGGDARQVSVAVLGSAISVAAGIPGAVTSASQAAAQADAAAQKAYTAGTQAVQDQAGVAGGVAQLDKQAQLYLQGQSVLAVTPATSTTSGAAATPAMLAPLLPMHPDTEIGPDGSTIGDVATQAVGALQKTGGDASDTVVTATSTPTPRQIAAIAADTVHLDQFRAEGVSDTVALTDANNAIKTAGRKVLHLPPGQTVTADGTADAQTLGDALIYGDGSKLEGAMGFAAHDWYHRAAFNLYKTITPEQLSALHTVCAQSQADGGATVVKIVTAGDSLLSDGDNSLTPDGVAGVIVANVIVRQLQGIYPNAKFQFINRCLGGSKWSDWDNSAYIAPTYFGLATTVTLRDSIPDDAALIIWCCGGNDAYSFTPSAFVGVVNYTATRCTSASQVFVINPSSTITTSTNAGDSGAYYGVQWAYSWIYTWCRVYGYGYIDHDSWIRMRRDGYYPHAVTLQQVGNKSTWFNQTITLDSSGAWTLPDIQNGSGVSAAKCTDFSVVLSMPSAATMEIRLGNGSPIARAYLYFTAGTNGKSFGLTVQDLVDADRKFVSGYDAPTAPIIGISIVDGNLRIIAALPAESQNGFDPTALSNPYSGGAGAETGLGFFEIFNVPVVQWRRQSSQQILGLPVGTKLLNLAVANASYKNPTVMPVRPDLTMYELYDSSLGTGGNNIAHETAFGWRETMEAVFAQQDWRPTLPANYVAPGRSISAGGITLSTDGAVIGDEVVNLQYDPSTGQLFQTVTSKTGYAEHRILCRNSDGSYPATALGSGVVAIISPQSGSFTALYSAGGVEAKQGFGLFGVSPVTVQPEITGTAPTDPIVKQLLAVAVACGLVKDGTTTTTTSAVNSSTVTSGGTVTSGTTSG